MGEYQHKSSMDRIIDASLKEIDEYLHHTAENAETNALVIISSYIPAREDCLRALHDFYGSGIRFAVTGCCGPLAYIENALVVDSEYELMRMTEGVSDLILVAPKMSLLKRITRGEDDGMIEHAVLRALMWGCDVSIYLDFDKAKCRIGVFCDWGDILDNLERMGIQLKQYRESRTCEEMMTLVTETEVVDAFNRGMPSVCCGAGAIITPLARDKASELGIIIEQKDVLNARR